MNHPVYFVCGLIGLILVLAFPVTRDIRKGKDRQQYYLLQAIMVIGAVLGAKISVLIGDYGWPLSPVPDWRQILWSGRSITGALILGFLLVEIAKPIIGYTRPPNDRFAALLPFSIALGRVGCLVEGCCAGIPYSGFCAMRGIDGVPRFPSQALEIVFQVSVGITFLLLVKRRKLHGHLFAIYLMLYGTFRFVTEFLRDTPKIFHGWSGYQWLSLIMISLGAGFFLKRSLARPASWDEPLPG